MNDRLRHRGKITAAIADPPVGTVVSDTNELPETWKTESEFVGEVSLLATT